MIGGDDNDDDKMFILYEVELKKSISSIDENIKNNITVNDIIMECNDTLKQMEIEARQIPSSEKKKICLAKISDYKSIIMRKKELGQRSQLIGEKSNDDRERMMTIQDKLNRQNDTILNAQKCVTETEDIGVNITKELLENRTKIESAGNKSKEVNADLDTAKKMLKSMQSRENCNMC